MAGWKPLDANPWREMSGGRKPHTAKQEGRGFPAEVSQLQGCREAASENNSTSKQPLTANITHLRSWKTCQRVSPCIFGKILLWPSKKYLGHTHLWVHRQFKATPRKEFIPKGQFLIPPLFECELISVSLLSGSSSSH